MGTLGPWSMRRGGTHHAGYAGPHMVLVSRFVRRNLCGLYDLFTLNAPIGYWMLRLGIATLVGMLLTALELVLGGELGDD